MSSQNRKKGKKKQPSISHNIHIFLIYLRLPPGVPLRHKPALGTPKFDIAIPCSTSSPSLVMESAGCEKKKGKTFPNPPLLLDLLPDWTTSSLAATRRSQQASSESVGQFCV